MSDWVEWDKVEAWLKGLGAKNVSTRKDYHEIDDMEIQVYSVSRGLGGKTLTAPLNVTTKLVTRPDGVKLRTLQCSREGVADLAKTLVIDPTKVLGPNWENEFRPQAEIYESEMDAEEESEEEESRRHDRRSKHEEHEKHSSGENTSSDTSSGDEGSSGEEEGDTR
jgi:hypothetical protein